MKLALDLIEAWLTQLDCNGRTLDDINKSAAYVTHVKVYGWTFNSLISKDLLLSWRCFKTASGQFNELIRWPNDDDQAAVQTVSQEPGKNPTMVSDPTPCGTDALGWWTWYSMTLKLRQIVLYLKELQYGAWSVTNANTFVKTEMQTKWSLCQLSTSGDI